MALSEFINRPSARSEKRDVHGIFAVLALCASINGCANKAVLQQVPQLAAKTAVNDLAGQCERKEYQDGDIIKTPVGDVQLKGWKLIVDVDAADAYLNKFPGKSFGFYLSDGLSTRLEYPDDLTLRGRRTLIRDNRKYLILPTFPRPESGKINLTLVVRQKGKEVEQTSYSLQLATNNTDKNGVPAKQVISEKPLPQVFEIQEFLNTIQSQLIIGRPNVVIYHPDRGGYCKDQPGCGPNGEFVPDSGGDIFVDMEYFAEPRLKDINDGQMVFFHEYAHYFMNDRIEKPLKQENHHAIYENYKRLLRRTGYKPDDRKRSLIQEQKEIKALREHPVFKIFREDSYCENHLKEKDKPLEMGHPHENYKELFASTLTTLKYFPQEFIMRYGSLNDEDKKAVAEEIKTLIEIMGVPLMKKFFVPEIETVKAACGI